MNDDEKFTLIAGSILVAAISIVVLLVTYRGHTNAQVVQLTWQRKVDIQQYMTVQESDWNVPHGGRETRRYSALHHYNHIYTGSTKVCSGTGKTRTCTSQAHYIDMPVYETKYDYDIDRWITVRTPERHGIGDNAVWPDVSDLKEGNALGCERAGTRYSAYTVHFTQDYSLDIGEERWRGFKPGQRVVLILDIFNRPLDVERPS